MNLSSGQAAAGPDRPVRTGRMDTDSCDPAVNHGPAPGRRGAASGLPFAYPLRAPTFDPPATQAELALVGERFAGAVLDDYRTFLQVCAGLSAMDIPNGYALFPPDLVHRIDDGPRTVKLNAPAAPVVPIGGDGGGNLLMLEAVAGHEARVWKWLHELGYDDSSLARDSVALLAPFIPGLPRANGPGLGGLPALCSRLAVHVRLSPPGSRWRQRSRR